ncbi:MAG: Veg family protein [Acetivibrio ethanolgignens]
MRQLDVRQVRKVVNAHIGSRVRIKSNKGRHKIDVTEGIITETYPSIFLVEVANDVEATSQMVSYSYTDVLTKDVCLSLM